MPVQDLARFHANIASHTAREPALRAAMAGRRAAIRRRNWELGLEYRQLFERLRQRADGGSHSCCLNPCVSCSSGCNSGWTVGGGPAD